jgi:hypothetical protein
MSEEKAKYELAMVENSSLLGKREEIREVGMRLQQFMPAAQRLTTAEAYAVAQIAVAHQLDPFNGEVWGLKGNDGQWRGVMVGIKGLRKCANRQAKQEGTTFWGDKTLVPPEKYGEPKTSVVYEFDLRDSLTTQAWANSIHALTTAGIPYAEAIAMLGGSPRKVGIGIARPEEKSKMGIHQRAAKRAEADALKQRFDVDFGSDVTIADEESGPIMEAQVTEMAEQTPETETQPPAQPKRTEKDNLQQLGFGDKQ